MKNKSLAIICFIVLLSWITLFSALYVCVIRGNCSCKETCEVKEPEVIQPTVSSLAINDEPSLAIAFDDNIHFNYAGATLTVPESMKDGFTELADYLKTNPSKKLVITGLYTSEEGDAQLGLDRAQAIANYLNENYGIPLESMETSYKEVSELAFDAEKTKTYGAGMFSFNTVPSDDTDLEALKAKIADTRFVHFETGSAIMDITPELHQFADDLKYYSEKAEDVQVSITGFTDSQGTESNNTSLSKDRAQSVKDYLVTEKGIDESIFDVSGMGEANPIASNDTKAGMAKNRRVEIKVQ